LSYPAIGQRLIILPSIDSTNNYAMGQAHAGLAGHGTVYFALEQTAGKGQRGKSWVTTVGENIMMSVVIEPHLLKTSDQFLLSVAIALGCYDFFKNYAGEETAIKWPNDIYWRDRKAGGILIENRIGNGQWLYAIAGMGLNINQTQFAEAARRPVSLKQITGKTYDIQLMARELCARLETRYQSLNDPEKLFADYQQALFRQGQAVKLKKGNTVFETTIQGVTRLGQLITRDALERYFEVGEIEWII